MKQRESLLGAQDCESVTAALRAFPAFAGADDHVLSELTEKTHHHKVPAGFMTSMQGTQCEHFPIVLDGTARVFTIGDNGREITLYRLKPGEGCVLAAASILSDLPLPAFAVTESENDLLLVSPAVFNDWFDRLAFWRRFVVSLISQNLAQVIAVTNATAFRRLDARVASHLLETPGPESKTTHQEIAAELGSSREVISRVLKSLEAEGLIKLHRGAVSLIDRAALAAKAELT